ncbi:hypothetical protein D3C72_1263600 [compost metagenome]
MAQIVTWHRWQFQIIGAWWVLCEVRTGEAFLLFQQCQHGRILLGEKLLQWLDFDRWRIAQRRQILQRQIAADRMVRPAPGARGGCTKQQQEEGQLHYFSFLLAVPWGMSLTTDPAADTVRSHQKKSPMAPIQIVIRFL